LNQSNYLQATALEGIENKTGTFHFDIDCPTSTTSGDITCTITGYVESGEFQKETDFDCYVDEGISPLNFNTMIGTTPYITTKTFSTSGLTFDQHTVTCKANYYNLGSRTDTFSDSFIFQSVAGTASDSNNQLASMLSSTDFDVKKLIKGLKDNQWILLLVMGGMFMLLLKRDDDDENNKKKKKFTKKTQKFNNEHYVRRN